jgi:hypothetical protein
MLLPTFLPNLLHQNILSTRKDRKKLKYYRENTLIIEYPSGNFIGQKCLARVSWRVAWTELVGDNVRILDNIQGFRHRIRRRIILVDLHCSKEQFVDSITKFFSQKLQVNPSQLRFNFKEWTPFGDLNAQT